MDYGSPIELRFYLLILTIPIFSAVVFIIWFNIKFYSRRAAKKDNKLIEKIMEEDSQTSIIRERKEPKKNNPSENDEDE